MIPDPVPGFFGKVSTHGDFVMRRLPADFLGNWDGWLQQSLQKSREQLKQEWLGTYLTSPIWRFALASPICSSSAWMGILMPSVDRVGRHFPLMIASPVTGQGSMLRCLVDAQDWYDCLETLALRTLNQDFSLERLDAELMAMPPLSLSMQPLPLIRRSTNCGYCLPIPGVRHIATSFPLIEQEINSIGINPSCLWWSDGSAQMNSSLLISEGLPAPSSFAAMLDGKWERWGWRTLTGVA